MPADSRTHSRASGVKVGSWGMGFGFVAVDPVAVESTVDSVFEPAVESAVESAVDDSGGGVGESFLLQREFVR